jgi:hypothetical protein
MGRLVVNADDLGLGPEINDGILFGLQQGFVSDTSLMPAAPRARQASDALHSLGVVYAGVHLDLDEPLGWAPGGRERYPRPVLKRMLAEGALLSECETQARRQIEAFLSMGLMPSHMDTHHHVHGFMPLFELVVGLAREYGIPALRFSPGGYRLPTRTDIPLDPDTARRMKARLDAEGIFTCGCMLEGAGMLGACLDTPPGCDTELVVHPSLGGDPWRGEELRVLAEMFGPSGRACGLLPLESFRGLALPG